MYFISIFIYLSYFGHFCKFNFFYLNYCCFLQLKTHKHVKKKTVEKWRLKQSTKSTKLNDKLCCFSM